MGTRLDILRETEHTHFLLSSFWHQDPTAFDHCCANLVDNILYLFLKCGHCELAVAIERFPVLSTEHHAGDFVGAEGLLWWTFLASLA